MTTKEKKLLLKDTCARLPYGVICKISYIINNETTDGEDVPAETDDKLLRVMFDNEQVYTEWLGDYIDVENIMPYLRPMSSMTEEEKGKYKELTRFVAIYPDELPELLDWLNENHFDYKGLIPKGLALEAPKDMYNSNEE